MIFEKNDWLIIKPVHTPSATDASQLQLSGLHRQKAVVLDIGIINSVYFITLLVSNPNNNVVVLYFKDQQGLDAAFEKLECPKIFTRDGSPLALPDKEFPNKTKAIFTIVQNGHQFIKLWYQYYKRFFASEDIYILDVGSQDNSLKDMQCQIIPVTPEDNLLDVVNGNKLVNRFQAKLFQKYQYVVFMDYDEILFHPFGLDKYINQLHAPYVTASGFEIIQKKVLPPAEPEIDFSRTILTQRLYWTRNMNYDKSCIISVEMKDGLGCHNIVGHPSNDHLDLYLIHLNKVDFSYLEKLHQKLHDHGSYLGGNPKSHLLGRDFENWWLIVERDASIIPRWIRDLNFI